VRPSFPKDHPHLAAVVAVVVAEDNVVERRLQ
jgi:hypothetical protein